MSASDPMTPSAALLVKLGSAVVHAAEAKSADGHEYDWIAFDGLLADRDVQEWLREMTIQGFLPVMRRNK